MKKMLAIAAAAMLPLYANAVVLTFDDHPDVRQGDYGPLGTYQGFTFTCSGCGSDRLDWVDTVGSSWPYGAVSGDFTMLNNYFGIGIVRAADGSDFTFDGMYWKAWADGSSAGSLTGLNNGAPVWTVATQIGASWLFVGAQADAIDELRIDNGVWLVDNLALNERSRSNVPLPGSAALLALGLIGVGAATRRLSKH